MKLAFVHIPRTGGNTVEHWLDYRFEAARSQAHRHLTWTECKYPENIPSFTIVRNPFDWHLSWFHILKRVDMGIGQLHQFCRRWEFENYIDWLERGHDTGRYCYPRWTFTCWTCGHEFDFVLRTENLAQDFKDMCRALGMDLFMEHKQISKTNHGPYRQYYTPRMRKVVERRHAQDLTDYNYSF